MKKIVIEVKNKKISMTSEGLTPIEIIGALTIYRNEALIRQLNDRVKEEKKPHY